MQTKTEAFKVQAMAPWGAPVRAAENWREDALGKKSKNNKK